MISVLYVDDEPDLLELTRRYLVMDKEFYVLTAPSAAAALPMIKSGGIQAIVSDYQMPGMDGIEFLKQVRSFDKNIPFILFTGKGREEIAVEAFENGADFYVQRGGPVHPQFVELIHKIKMAVDRRRAEARVMALNRLYTVLSATNKAIVHIHDRKELLNEICRIVIEKGGLQMAWAGVINPATSVIEPIAAYGQSDNFPETIFLSVDDDPQSPAGIAFHKETYFVSNDIAADPRMTAWGDTALGLGFRSVAAFPFALQTKNAGVMAFYASETGFFNDPIIRLLDEQSQDISFALRTLDHEEQRIAAENKLKASELQYRRLFETAQHPILILDGNSFEIIDANTFVRDLLGYPLEYFVGRHLWDLGFSKDKPLQKEAFSGMMKSGYTRCEDLRLETREGRIMDVELISNVNLVGDKRIIQCTLRDVTERKMMVDQIRLSLAEKETLLKEIHHRVKNNIQVISSILHIQSEYAKDPAVVEIFRETQNKVKGIALIHEKLYQSKSLSQIDYADYLKSITTYMFQSYNVDPRQIHLRIDAERVVINIDQAVPLSLIITEMLTNALKHAFPGDRMGEIIIRVKTDKDHIMLHFSDDGVGMPESVTFEKADSLGMNLLAGLTRQLGGTISLDRIGGTRYSIIFPGESQVKVR